MANQTTPKTTPYSMVGSAYAPRAASSVAPNSALGLSRRTATIVRLNMPTKHSACSV